MSDFDEFATKSPFDDPAVLQAARQANTTKVQVLESDPIISQTAEQELPQAASHHPPSPKNQELEPTSFKPISLGRENAPFQQLSDPYTTGDMTAPGNLSPSNMDVVRAPNFPRLPSWFPFTPCFYINISQEIPLQHQLLVKNCFRKFYAFCIILMINVIVMGIQINSNLKGVILAFVLSIIVCLIEIPASFIFATRSVYCAIRSNSSGYFVLFFLAFGIETVLHFFQAMGFEGGVYAGYLNGSKLLDDRYYVGGTLSLILGLAYTALLFYSVFLFSQVRKVYKSSGANLQQARNEFQNEMFKRGVSSAFQS